MPAPKPARSEPWLPKSAAAALLGVATRQLERRTRQGYIESRREPRKPHESTAPVLYSRADIEALKAGTPNMHAVAIEDVKTVRTAPGSSALPVPTTALARVAPAVSEMEHFARLLATIQTARAVAPPAVLPGPFVALADAVAISGMPAAWLLKQARAGVSWAVNVGTGKREHWRFAVAASA